MNQFKISYVTTLPKEGNAPRVSITGTIPQKYLVKFYELNNGLISSGYCETNQTIVCTYRQWFTLWKIIIEDENNDIVYTDFFNPQNKTIFIKMDAYALGDNIAWMPYIEEFRKKWDCHVICSTFHNNIFYEYYPNILFVKPNTVIENVYAQYYIGASDDGNIIYSKNKTNEIPLQKVASDTLGMEYIEIKPNIRPLFGKYSPKTSEKYVTLSEHASSEKKAWKEQNGWQMVVDYLNNRGYKVLVISKEPTALKNVIDLTGDKSLDERISDIMHARCHFGVSSGLSWLAWVLGTPVVMISDVTPSWHEFQSNILRINENELKSIDYGIEGVSSIEKVLKNLDNWLD
jgi:autotransporter strand-loop-strand O-heptosyltransferase